MWAARLSVPTGTGPGGGKVLWVAGVQQAQGAAELSGGVLGILPLLARVA